MKWFIKMWNVFKQELHFLTLNKKVSGFGPLFFGPYNSLSRSLERKTHRNRWRIIFCQQVWGMREKSALTSPQKQRTDAHPEYFLLAPRCCICNENVHQCDQRSFLFSAWIIWATLSTRAVRNLQQVNQFPRISEHAKPTVSNNITSANVLAPKPVTHRFGFWTASIQLGSSA